MRGVLLFFENRAMSAGAVKLLQWSKCGLAIWVERADISILMNLCDRKLFRCRNTKLYELPNYKDSKVISLLRVGWFRNPANKKPVEVGS